MAKNGWKAESIFPQRFVVPGEEGEESSHEAQPVIDLEDSARDKIAELIGRRFKGHHMAWLVEKVLQAQGYTTYRSPEGPDYGIDIMAAPGPLGFGQPRIVVQVKSFGRASSPAKRRRHSCSIDRPDWARRSGRSWARSNKPTR